MSDIQAAARFGRRQSSGLLSAFFGIAESEADFARRRFATHLPQQRARLERAGRAFLAGYNAALTAPSSIDALLPLLAAVDADLAGFAHEGAAMALALLDLMTVWRRWRWRSLIEAAPQHTYLSHVGAGWALARLHVRRVPSFLRVDALLWPLVIDGYGFHEGFFKPERMIRRAAKPPAVEPCASFDQGLGRSLWFVCAADPSGIADTIANFSPHRHADLWSGVGLACAYAGAADAAAVTTLRDRAGDLLPHVAQGVVFATKARQRAGNLTADADLACRLLCGLTSGEAAAIADETTRGLSLQSDGAYEEWRRRIRERWR